MSHLPHACDDEDCSLSDGPPQHSLVCALTRLTEPLLTILHTQTHTSMLVCHIMSARYSTPMITSVHSRSDQSVDSGFHTHQPSETTKTTHTLRGAIKKFSAWPSSDQNKIKIEFASYSSNAQNMTGTIWLLGYKYFVHFSVWTNCLSDGCQEC